MTNNQSELILYLPIKTYSKNNTKKYISNYYVLVSLIRVF